MTRKRNWEVGDPLRLRRNLIGVDEYQREIYYQQFLAPYELVSTLTHAKYGSSGMQYLPFPTAADNDCGGNLIVRINYGKGLHRLTSYWRANNALASKDIVVQHRLSSLAVGSNTFEVSLNDVQTTVSVPTTVYELFQCETTSTSTNDVGGDAIYAVEIARIGTSGSDNLGIDAELVGVLFEFLPETFKTI